MELNHAPGPSADHVQVRKKIILFLEYRSVKAALQDLEQDHAPGPSADHVQVRTILILVPYFVIFKMLC
jgi:hypothetical protein